MDNTGGASAEWSGPDIDRLSASGKRDRIRMDCTCPERERLKKTEISPAFSFVSASRCFADDPAP